MQVRLPIPNSWQDFETLCQQLWKEIWCDSNTQRNGRSGQPQSGVDVFGRPIYSVGFSGVQCKDKDTQLGSALKIGEINAECDKARKFTPLLSTFTLATTAPRDGAIQAHARQINTNKHFPFDVHIWAWDDIASEILARPILIDAFYKGFPASPEALQAKISVSAPRDQFKAFFSRPAIREMLGEGIRDAITQVAYELSDNAFLHGKANHVQLAFDGTTFSIEDDGVNFNPLAQLDASHASATGHLGSWVLLSFINDFSGEININHERLVKNGSPKNKLSIELSATAKQRVAPEVVDIPIDLSTFFGRNGADRYAESLIIPGGVSEVVLTVGKSQNFSGTASFILSIRNRIPSTVKVTVSHARGDRFGKLADFFKAHNVHFQSR